MSPLIDKIHRGMGRRLNVRPVPVQPSRGVLSLSFDDIPVTAWTEGGPILAQYDLKATYYVCGGLSGAQNMGLPQFEPEHLQAIHAAGHEIGCHTFEHVSTLELSARQLEVTLARNAAWVDDVLGGYEMTTFAYPFGDCALRAKSVLDQRFLCSRGVGDGVNIAKADRNLLRAIGLESRRLPGYDLEALVEKTADQRGWLIAYGHEVMDGPTPYGCTPADLERLIRLALDAGLDIRPVGEAWHLMNPGP